MSSQPLPAGSRLPVVVLDIGGVLASNGLDFDRPDLRLAHCDLDELKHAYWRYRDAYDLGGPDETYWDAVVADALGRPNPKLADQLAEADADQWVTALPGASEMVAELIARGYELWLLSNAPHPMVRTARAADWSKPFSGGVFSAEVGLMKPDPRIYRFTSERIGVDPSQLIFFDDRPANVEAARTAGWRAEHFTGDHSALLHTVGTPHR
ncbi:HAD family hydrolase [Naumannella halotolerans]|uniref:Putative hydrolase of the HAD superfamily n=1 Tax=Naumannella halotolerans TaxID=993414 RepID=A0A4R7J5S5_9ACTN|nr:HAD family phosphatase [Naumannella halotolerans]TDT32700.1 putative hydrolase of the HAD superfamily [Naumannella halotolerans]